MKKLLGLLAAVALCVPLMTGCGSLNKERLEVGGAYAVVGTEPDILFLLADASFKAAEQSLTTVLEFERANRELLWAASPEIKRALDKIRPDALKAKNGYLDAREAYKLNPTPDNLTALQGFLSDVERWSQAVNVILPNIAQ